MIVTHFKPEYQDEVIQMIKQTIHTINRKDYTSSQVEAWADFDPSLWRESLVNHQVVIALDNHCIVGFADMNQSGYLDRLFVHVDYQRRGIAQKLVSFLEEANNTANNFTTYASITAKPFFESMNYRMITENQVALRGETFTNFLMKKEQNE